jgi:hypothetical protein
MPSTMSTQPLQQVTDELFTIASAAPQEEHGEVSRFYAAKVESRAAIDKVAQKYANSKMTMDKVSAMIQDTMRELVNVKEHHNIEFSVFVDRKIQTLKDNSEGFFVLTTMIEYADVPEFGWEFQTAFDPGQVTIFVAPLSSKNKTGPDDYYVWKIIARGK